MFKINQTYGYESGFYLGTPDHNYLYGLDVDLYENYYCGWERVYPETNLSAWNYKVGWGASQYDILWGKVNSKSNSLQWITNVNTENGYQTVIDPDDGLPKVEFLYNRDRMYSIAVSPYGGLVLVVAQTYFLVAAFDGDPNTLGSV